MAYKDEVRFSMLTVVAKDVARRQRIILVSQRKGSPQVVIHWFVRPGEVITSGRWAAADGHLTSRMQR